MIPIENCPLCKGDVHTQHHILNNCSAAANQQRYLWRHNSILSVINYYIASILNDSMKLYVDIPGYESADDLFSCDQRPDMVLVTPSKVTLIELTICFETNLQKSREYKKERYRYLQENVEDQGKKAELLSVEFSSLDSYAFANHYIFLP